jgi:hypothetical protein
VAAAVARVILVLARFELPKDESVVDVWKRHLFQETRAGPGRDRALYFVLELFGA